MTLKTLAQWFWFGKLDPWRYGIELPYNGDNLIWLFPWKRKNFNCDGTSAVWYAIDLGQGFKSLAEIDAFWEWHSEAARAAALREEAAREDVYF